jgi:hypothetical protein
LESTRSAAGGGGGGSAEDKIHFYYGPMIGKMKVRKGGRERGKEKRRKGEKSVEILYGLKCVSFFICRTMGIRCVRASECWIKPYECLQYDLLIQCFSLI